MSDAKTGIEKFQNKKVAIMGLGVVGEGCRRFLLKNGCEVDIYTNDEAMISAGEAFDQNEIDKNAEKYDFIAVSPGIYPNKVPALKNLIDSGIELYNDITIFLEAYAGRNPVIGVTGSNGKSTTVTLIHEAINGSGKKSLLGGNIGKSPLDWFTDDEIGDEDFIVLEISSYSMEYFKDFHNVDVLVYTSLSPNHLDRYGGDICEYAKTKLNCTTNGTKVILNGDDKGIDEHVLSCLSDCNPIMLKKDEDKIFAEHENGNSVQEKEEVFDLKIETRLQGLHNMYNIASTIAVLRIFGLENQGSLDAIKNFPGLTHRQQFVRELENVKYINDSKSTSPDATLKALEAFSSDKNIVLIIGGMDKNMDLQMLEAPIKKFVSKIIVLPGDLEEKVMNLPEEKILVQNMQEAVQKARESAQKDDTILLSPCSASFNLYKNFEERGEDFIKIVSSL